MILTLSFNNWYHTRCVMIDKYETIFKTFVSLHIIFLTFTNQILQNNIQILLVETMVSHQNTGFSLQKPLLVETWPIAFSRGAWQDQKDTKNSNGKSSMWLELDLNPCSSSDHTARTVNSSTAGGVWYKLSTFCPSRFKQGKLLMYFLKVITVEGWQWQLWSEQAAAQIDSVSREAGTTDPSI